MLTLAQIRRVPVTDDPVGDLITDMRRDRLAPKRFATLEAMTGYLWSRGACPEALDAARELWHRLTRAPDDREDGGEKWPCRNCADTNAATR